MNGIVGSGTLITFPTLLAFGYSPVLANTSNTTGLVAGNLTSVAGWRRELEGQLPRALRLGIASVLGGLVGAVLLFTLPASAFRAIVPAFIGIGVALVLLGPRIVRLLAARSRRPAREGGPGAAIGLFLCGVYGGYFGAGQGIVIIAILGLLLEDTLHRLNALRNVLAGATNVVAAIAFVAAAQVAWSAVLLVAVGSILGGWIGPHLGRRLPPAVYRAVIVAVGIVAMVKLLA